MTLALANIALSAAYLFGVGFLSYRLARIAWASGQRSTAVLFGGLVAMALSCGPHHLEHGLHQLAGQPGTPLEAAAMIIALPFGAVWLVWQTATVYPRLLGRVPTDWRIDGTSDAPIAFMFAVIAYVAATIAGTARGLDWTPQVAIQATLVALYMLIGWFLSTGQLATRRQTGTWSAKGVALTCIFPTCGVLHWAVAVQIGSGAYRPDWHMAVIDGLGIPTAAAFCAIAAHQRALSFPGHSHSHDPLDPHIGDHTHDT